MKKEVSGNKKKLGLIIAIAAVALLAVVGVVLALVLGGQGSEEKFTSKLYWNIDGKTMLSEETAMSTRKPAEDGLYYIRYLVGGEIVEIPFADKKLVTQADRREIACLKFDADGIAIEIVDPEEVYVRIQDKTYVQAIDGNKITTNTSTVLNGMKKQIEIPEDVKIVNVATRTGKVAVGEIIPLEIFDQVLIYGTDEETITDVFVTDRYWESKIYWSTAQRAYWDASKKVSTRPLADDGYWYIDLACEGEVKTYKVAQQDCIDVLDSKGPTDAATGVVFNEEGAIVNLFNAGLACRGTLQANSYDITDISEDGKTFTATRIMFGTEIGKTFTGTITDSTQIYNMTSTADSYGEPTTLQMNDRLQVFVSADGSIHTIFVVNRMVDSPFYYNLSRKWSTVNGLTREPNEDGYYVYELAVDGKVKTVRTKDRKIAEQMDGANLSVFGLALKGDIVTKVYDAVNVAGNWSFSTSNFVQTTEGGILGTVSTSGTAANGVMAADCKVFDVSQCYKNFRGEKATVREGDQILAYQNAVGEITHIWILNRWVKGTAIYWNCNRYYANGETTRTPDEDGYYVFNAIKAGTTKVVELKTKDKDVASRFDKEGSTTAAALKLNGNIITAAYPAPAAIGGYYRLSAFWVYEKNVNDDPNTYAMIARTGAIGNITLADDCKVMNFSTIINNATGESTTLKLGDYCWPIAGQDGKIHYLFIVEREVEGTKLAWRKNSLATIKDEDGNVMTDKDGNKLLETDADGYYVFTLWVNGKVGTYKTKDLAIANYVNGRSTAFAVKLSGNIITGAYTANSQPDTRASSVSYYDYVKTVDGVMHLKRNRVGQTDTGNEMTVTLADNYKAYNFDPAAGDDWGKQVKLNKGDRVYAYSDNNGESYVFFIMYRCTLEGGNEQYCEHCGKKVHWESIFAGYSPAAGCIPDVTHYYVPVDYATTGFTLGNTTQTTEGKGTEIVLNLNGKTLTRKGTLNSASGLVNAPSALISARYGNTLIIADYSKAKTGKITTEEGTVYNSAGSLLHVESGSKLVIDSGTIDGSLGTVDYTAANGGTISVGGELVVNGGTIKGRPSNGSGTAIGAWGNTSITINGGTIIGNDLVGAVANTGYGGTIATNGNLTVNGGTIKGGTASAGGDNIYVGKDTAEVAFNGGTVDGGVQIAAAKSVTLSGKPQIAGGDNYGLKMPGTIKADATGLKAGAKVFVDVSGVFTTDFASAKDAQKIIDTSALKSGAVGMILKVEGKAIASVSDGKLREWTDSTKLPEIGRWKLMTDVKLTSRVDIVSDVYIDLNGHDIVRTVDATGATDDPRAHTNAAIGYIKKNTDGTESAVGGTNQAIRVNGGKLTIDDTSKKADGKVYVQLSEEVPIFAFGGVIHVASGEFVLEGGTIDGSNLDNIYYAASNGTISSGAKITVNGGTIKGFNRGSGNGGAIGSWAGSEITVNGGEIYAGGSYLNDNGSQKVNGAAIATTGSLTINGGKIIGPGYTTDAEKKARSGGLIYVNGDSLEILGGELVDGFGTGYGFNVYYQRDYYKTVDGVRTHFSGAGEVVIGGDAFIKGGVTIRSGSADSPVKLTVKDTAVIDSTGAVSATNVRLVNGELYLNNNKKATTTTKKAGIEDNANYDISLVYTCQNVPKGFTVSNVTKYEHTYGSDDICDDCGHDRAAIIDWTDAKSVPTKAGNYRLMTDITLDKIYSLNEEVYIDLNGHDITRNVANTEAALKQPQIFHINNKLTIDDTSAAGDGTVSIKVADDAAITAASAVIHVAGGEFVLNGGIIDGSNVDNLYTNANNGTISVNTKMTMNGGTIKGFKRGSANGGAIGAWANTEVTITGGTIYAGGSFLNASDVQKVNGAAIATTGKLKITGGEIVGPGASATAEQRARSGGLIYANGDSLEILGGTFRDGFGTGYGFNIYYERNYRGTADPETGVRPTIQGGGTVVIGGNTFIKGGVTVRSAVDTDPVKLTVKGNAVIDSTGAVAATNVRLYNGHLYLNNNKTATTKAPANENYDISLVYTCKNVPTGYTVGNVTKYTHAYGEDGICDDCGKNEVQEWTDGTKIPTTAGKYKLMTNITLDTITVIGGEVYIDLNGFNITRNVANTEATLKQPQVFHITGKLTIDDTSAAGDGTVSILVADEAAITSASAVVHVASGEFVLNGGIIDGSNVDNLYTAANNGTVSVNTKMTMNGGVIKGFKRGSSNGGAIGAWANTEVTVTGGTIYAGGSFLNGTTQKVNGAAIATTGKLEISGGEIIGPGASSTAEQRARSGGLIYANGDSLTITGGTFRDGFGTGYGFNIYYERNYKGTADPVTGVRPTIQGGGEVTISGDTFIKGGLTVRSSKSDDLVKLTIKNGVLIDDTGAVGSQNIRLYNGALYLNEDTTATTTAPENANYDISLVYTCQNNVIKGFVTGHAAKFEHNYGDDNVCDDCGHVDIQIALSKTSVTLNEGDEETITTTTLDPATATVAWTSSNEAVATVDANGKITAVAAGSATITATATYETYTKSVTCSVTVNSVLPDGWVLWNATASADYETKLPTSGKYRLTKNVTLSATCELAGDLILDLNGFTVTSSVAPVIKTGGKNLTITDLSGKTGDQLGKITTATLTGSINGMICANGSAGTVTIENGIIDGSNITTTYTGANAGTITVSKNLVISGGKVIGWNSCGNGGAIGSWGSTSITISGGEIVGGAITQSGTLTATGHGGAIAANGNLTISGGKISGGTAVNGGDNIWINNAASVVTISGGEIDGGVVLNNFAATSAISGSVTIKQGANYGLKIATGKTIDMTGLTGGEIYIDAEGVFTTNFPNATAANTVLALLKQGKTAATGEVLAVDGTAIKSAVPTTPEPEPDDTPIEEQAWVEWTTNNALPTAGKYKLMTAVNTTASTSLTGDLWIDLNGYTITRTVTSTQTSKQYVFNVNNAEHTLLIDDLSGKTGDQLGKVTASYASGVTCSTSGGLIQVDLGELVLNNGIIDGTPITANITTANNAAVMIADRFTMNGGTILGQYSKKYQNSGQSGSAIGAWGNSEITINGGTVQAYQVTGSSYACSSGACIATSGKLTINGGTLIGSRAGARGGLIYAVANSGKTSFVTINGGVLKNGFGLSGGAIFAQNVPLTITDGVITGCKASQAANGHSIDFIGDTLTIGGNAVIGGGVTVRSSGKLVLKDAPVVDDTLGTVYANITLNSASAYLNDTTGTAIQTANGNYSLTYGTDGKVNGLTAYAARALTESATLPTSGNVKLTSDVTLDAAMTLTGDLKIDLNGHTITRNVAAAATGAQYAIIADGKTLIITDSAETKGSVKTLVEGDAAVAIEVGVVKAANGGKVILDAVLDGNDVKTSYVTDNAAAVTVNTGSQFVMLGGHVKGITNTNAATSSKPGGSAIAVPSTGAASKIVIYGGKVEAFQSTTSVSNCAPLIYNKAANTVIYIYDGELVGSRATNHSGGIMTNGNMYIYGGKISGGTAYHSGLIQSTGAVLEITGGTLVGGKATANAGGLGGASIDYAKSGGVLTIGGNAKIAGGVSLRGDAILVLKDKAVIDMNMAGQEQKLFNIRFKSASTNGTNKIYLNDTTGTPLANAKTGTWDVAYDAAGNITGITAK